MEVLGIDIGGSGIKGAIVDTRNGELLTERQRIATPQPATPQSIAEVVGTLSAHFQWKGTIGCGFPASVHNGVAMTASNIDNSWIGTNIEEIFKQSTGCKTIVKNDADVAGIAELTFGAGKNENGIFLLLTIGTGIGSALFTQRKLVPNTEFGHIYMANGKKAEDYTSDAVRKNEALKWPAWGERFNEYLQYLEHTFWPDIIVIGGGASKKFHKFAKKLSLGCEVVPAQLLNHAGIIGAALAAA